MINISVPLIHPICAEVRRKRDPDYYDNYHSLDHSDVDSEIDPTGGFWPREVIWSVVRV